MQYVELNPAGHFDPWERSKLQELTGQKLKTSLGVDLIFENQSVKLWEVYLHPGERIPFRIVNSNFCWVCKTGGLAISRYGNGKISMLRFEKGDTDFLEFKGKNYVFDLENIDEHPLEIDLLEYKDASILQPQGFHHF